MAKLTDGSDIQVLRLAADIIVATFFGVLTVGLFIGGVLFIDGAFHTTPGETEPLFFGFVGVLGLALSALTGFMAIVMGRRAVGKLSFSSRRS